MVNAPVSGCHMASLEIADSSSARIVFFSDLDLVLSLH